MAEHGTKITMRQIMLFICMLTSLPFSSYAKEVLRIFTWDGYVTAQDLLIVNKQLKLQGYNIEASVISPFASGPEQMFNVLRAGKTDISFLTLNYIKMQEEKTSKLLQVIDTQSPRIPNYKKLRTELTQIPMGKNGKGMVYIPFGGGAYGIWANMNKLNKEELPVSISDLWNEKWKGKLSLAKGQIQPNIALVMLSLNKSPYYINDLITSGKRREAIKFVKNTAQKQTNLLYQQVHSFWDGTPNYDQELLLTSSYGVEIAKQNTLGGKWEYIHFEEGSTVWLDTINFAKHLSGTKLEAAEIVANYFISKTVQTPTG
ncbi:extracellular solute-binding protein [Shewanella sp. D64]|uniref:ABC transporter substrate-binding protein n=1 Tax=unclassified Shewanella TaxID=196818 RepID=UPI0022BA3943|nr:MULTISPECIES: ABC transporter substrate-binding protein [unclassified Shewanella]MEC4728440.1 extracellular solute-binding protein [Shewanella sp. D64]MEC4740462.1 extracellular solute-binding protein [Shewanella sp. E94]WBJ94022.1 extracellular solute-binding protein [Shewanella sp. MTB7]